MKQVIKTGVHGIVVTVEGGMGSIVSDLKTPCDHCGKLDCTSQLFNFAIDGIESLILAAACAGIDITAPAFLQAIETAVDAASNTYGD
jgi:hypothetical protein